jgi:hypothetical protein
MRPLLFTLAAILVLAVPSVAMSQVERPRKVGIIVGCSCDDPVGSQYATDLRDEIARSPRYFLTSDTEQKDAQGKFVAKNFELKIVSMDADDKANPGGHSTVISAVLVIDGTYIDQWVQACGVSKTTSCAKSIFSSIDKDVEDLYKILSKQ